VVSAADPLGKDSVNMSPRRNILVTTEMLNACVSVYLRVYSLSLIGNNLIKTFSRQGIVPGSVVLYLIRVESKESDRSSSHIFLFIFRKLSL
jgi:hypothetical protein